MHQATTSCLALLDADRNVGIASKIKIIIVPLQPNNPVKQPLKEFFLEGSLLPTCSVIDYIIILFNQFKKAYKRNKIATIQ